MSAAAPCYVVPCSCSCLLQDLPLLDLHPDRITYASDYFEEMVATATGLIDAGFLYADDTPSDEVRLAQGGCVLPWAHGL